MFGIPSPILLASVLVVSAAGGFSYGTSMERKAREAEVFTLRQEHSDAVALAALEHAVQVQLMRDVERGLRGDIDTIQAQRAKEIADAKVENDRIVADLLAGNRRLSIAVKSCAATRPEAGGAGAGSGAGPEAARADIDDAAAQRLIAITREGDDAIRDLNTCIGAYEAVRRRINGAAR